MNVDTPRQGPSIAIVGGGPAGLTLAVLLKRYGLVAVVFESDAAFDARDQGGMLDLHPGEGQFALSQIGLLDDFLEIARHEDQEQRFVDHATAAILHEDIPIAGEGDRPEIDRVKLRRLLLSALDAPDVQWRSRVQEVVQGPDGGWNLVMEDEVAGPFDLVVGADGAWSKVRRAMTSVMPDYTGVSFVEFWLNDVDVRHPDLSRLVGHGTMFALGDSKGLIAQRNGGETIRVYAAFHRALTEGERRGAPAVIDVGDVLTRFDGWANPLRRLIVDADRLAAVRPIMALPATLAWTGRPGLTIIGDAAHVMPPLGTGVNLAMLDAVDLGRQLVEARDWRDGVQAFEMSMLARARRIARETADGFREMFSPDAVENTLGHMREQRIAAHNKSGDSATMPARSCDELPAPQAD